MPVRREGDVNLKSRNQRREQLKEPEEFRVVLLNDQFTTMDFVVEILVSIFHKDRATAKKIMLDVHKKGRGIVGQYPWDIAQTKVSQVHKAAHDNDFPLKCVVEPV